MELKEMIKVMQHYENFGDIEIYKNDRWTIEVNPIWNWDDYKYRIKEPKQKVTIEKWLCLDKQGKFVIIEASDIEEYTYITKKVKLIETYEVEL